MSNEARKSLRIGDDGSKRIYMLNGTLTILCIATCFIELHGQNSIFLTLSMKLSESAIINDILSIIATSGGKERYTICCVEQQPTLLPRPLQEPRDSARGSASFHSKLTRFAPLDHSELTMHLGSRRVSIFALFALVLLGLFVGQSTASLGDHLPDFKECVQVTFPGLSSGDPCT